MANRARDILIRFLGDDKGLKKVTGDVATETGKVAKGFKAITTAIGALVAAGAVRILQRMAEAAAQEADEQTKLATVLRNTTRATDQQIESVERWVTAMQMATNVADTDLRQSLQSLTIAGMTTARAQDAISVAIDIAAARGLALKSVIDALVRAMGSGQTAGLSRLGIATRNAAGEMLSLDQILNQAAETMGGTARRAAFDLAGQMEQVDLAFADMQESAPALARGFARLKEAMLLTATAVTDLSNELPQARTLLNELVRTGVDPFTDRVPAMIAVLGELARDGFRELGDSAEFLQVALGSTTQDMIEARGGIITYGEAWGFTKEQIAAMVEALNTSIGQFDSAVLATNRHQAAMSAAAGATRDFTAALAEQRDAMKEATDPVFASAKAEERLAAAHDKYTRAVVESGEGSEEANSALGDLLTSQRDVESANAAMADSFSGATLTALESWGAQIGINNEALREWINLQREAAGLPALTLPGLPSGDRFALDQLNRTLNTVNRGTVRND